MNIKKISIVLFLLVFGLLLTSCEKQGSEKEQTDLEVLSFTHDVEGYTYEESANLEIKVKNYKNYEIVSFQINNEIYPVENVEGGVSVLRIQVPLMLGINNFELKNIKYKVNGNENTLNVSNFKCSTTRLTNLNETSPITIKELSLKDQAADHLFYNGDKVTFVLVFENAKAYEIKTIILNDKEYVLENDTKTNCEISFTIKDDTAIYSITSLVYVDPKKGAQTIEYEVPYSIELNISSKGIVPLEFNLDISSSENVIETSIKQYATMISSKVNFKVKVSNEDKVTLTKFVLSINGVEKEVNNWKLNKNTQMYQVYEFEIWFTDSLIDTQEIKLSRVIYKNYKNEEYSASYKATPTYKIDVYDGIIKTFDDFKAINDNLGGNYILANNIALTSAQSGSYIIGNFNGKLNGCGYSISGNGYGSTATLFNSIGSKAIITNVNFKNWQFVNNKESFACLTNTNYGSIYNVTFSNCKVTSVSNVSEVSLITTENHGTIQDSYISYNDISINGSVYGICKTNHGDIQRMYLNYGKINSTDASLIYLTIKNTTANSVFANSIIDNETTAVISSTLTKFAKIILGPETVSEDSTVSGVYYNADMKSASGYFKLENNSYVLKNEGTWNDSYISEVSNSNLRTSIFYTSVLGFNNGTENVYWRIVDGYKARLLIMY